MNSPQFTQYEFEHAIYQTLAYGMETELARELGVSPGLISQYFNPSDERESVLFKAAVSLSALIVINQERGCNALQTFNSFVNRALEGKEICVDTAKRNAIGEHNDYVLAEVEQKPLDDRIRELEESVTSKLKLLDGLRAERKREILESEFVGTVAGIRRRPESQKVVGTGGR